MAATVLLLICLGCAPALGSDFLYSSQSRSVTAKTHGIEDLMQTVSSTSTGDFNARAYAPPDSRGFGSAAQSQVSTLGARNINVTSRFDGTAPAAAGTGRASGISIVDVTFSVADNTPVTLSAFFTGLDNLGDFVDPQRLIELSGPGMNVSWTFAITTSAPFTASQSGMLTPGSYHLTETIESIVGSSTGFIINVASGTVTLTPEPTSLMAPIGLALLLGNRCRRGG
jgi:hypothetical protein